MISAMRRRLFVVPFANNNHGKTTLVRSMVTHAARFSTANLVKGRRILYTPWAQEIDAYVFPRSYQEVEKKEHGTVRGALSANDPTWWQRDLIVMPSHSEEGDCAAMILEAHAAGFDAVVVSILLDRKEVDRKDHRKCTSLHWDVRWCIDNSKSEDWKCQVESLGRDLWFALSAMAFPKA